MYFKNLKKSLLLIFSIGFFASIANAQIYYDGRIFNIGGATENGKFSWIVDKLSGMYWNFGDNFFQIDLTPTNPRIAGTGNKIVFYNTFTSTFNDIQVATVYNYSDERAKTNIQTLNGGLNTVLNLRPVSYNWKVEENTVAAVSAERSSSFGPNEESKTQYGFLAQDVEKILPDAVTTDENGNKLINYTAIIPHLVQSVQELQGIVAEQETIIENLSAQTYSTTAATLDKIIKCTPNPTSGIITFEYTLTNPMSSAAIFVSDLTGDIMKSIDCELNSTSITEDLSVLRDGIYLATLSVDGEVKDSKQFIIRK